MVASELLDFFVDETGHAVYDHEAKRLSIWPEQF
jgi:hypothetical protein